MPAKISRVSALIPLLDWMTANNRAPTTKECRPDNGGLCHYSTYARRFHTLSAAVSAAWEVQSHSSSCISSFRAPQLRPCLGLGCSELIVIESNSVRHCRLCRKRLFAMNRSEIDPPGAVVSTAAFWCHSLWRDRSWDDLLDEATITCH